jgi:hypothetical protein
VDEVPSDVRRPDPTRVVGCSGGDERASMLYTLEWGGMPLGRAAVGAWNAVLLAPAEKASDDA